MNITLRIKRKYFELIRLGHKTIEFRDCKPFYDKLFANRSEIKTLTFHYQGRRKLICDVQGIVRINMKQARELSPEDFEEEEKGISFGTHCWAIVVRKPRCYTKNGLGQLTET